MKHLLAWAITAVVLFACGAVWAAVTIGGWTAVKTLWNMLGG